MTVRKYAIAATVLVAGATTALAQNKETPDLQTKEGIHQRMQSLAESIDLLKARVGSSRELDRLVAEYERWSQFLGGDQPARVLAPSTSASTGFVPVGQGPQFVSTPPCGGTTPSTSSFSGTTGVISAGAVPTVFTASVSGQAAYLWDVNLNLAISHTASDNLDITLTSPAGTTIVVTTDNGGSNDNVFNGTVFDDNINDTATDHIYANNVVATPLTPEGRLGTFRGEDPNGTWTLTVTDDAATNIGTVNSWSLDLSSLGFAPLYVGSTQSNSPGAAIVDNATTADSMTFGGIGTYLAEVELYTEITHTFAGDLDITLISPTGTIVKVTTDNGAGNDNVFNGTLWDNDSANCVTDFGFANLVVASSLQPEGGFDDFLGEDPNGLWTLSIFDDANGDIGTLVRWDLTLRTTSDPSAPAPTNVAGTTGAITDAGTGGPTNVNFTSNVSGMGSYLWDIDLTTGITHTSCADLDIKLTSPAGTTVIITTDNGGTNDHVFNGTLWDDNANAPATDFVYANASTASPLSPEGRLSAFRGENPNGTWTLNVVDDAAADGGSMNSWSLTVTTVSPAPTETTNSFSASPNVAIPDFVSPNPGVATDSQTVSGAGTFLDKLVLYTEITHTFPGDLEISLQSPAGTIVIASTRNGGTADNCFNGTNWDPDSTDAVTDHTPYTVNVVVPVIGPEGAFDNFAGQDPNGLWTIKVTDNAGVDVGTLVRWDLNITTCAAAGPVSYCPPQAPGTTNGCLPSIAATANPDVAHSNTCVITVSQVEGQKSGIIFYGLATNNAVWCSGGNSFLCVKAPTQRTGTQTTGGTVGQCDGSLTLDWNAYQLSHPGALGQVWAAGDHAYVQGWFRDPPACKTTFLSEALDLTYQP